MKACSRKQVEGYIKENTGIDVELIPHGDFFTFRTKNSVSWKVCCVFVPRVSDVSLEEWLKDFNYLRRYRRQHFLEQCKYFS